jgi:hypothetical protein
MSEILVNKLTGTSTAGSILVTGEGNSTTTNLQQGLCKVWSRFNGSSFAGVDSFNQASVADDGTGWYTVNMTNPYSANEGSHTTCSGAYHTNNRGSGSASTILIGTYNSSHALADESRVSVLSHGDLA